MMMADNPKITVEVEAKGVQSTKASIEDLGKRLSAVATSVSQKQQKLNQLLVDSVQESVKRRIKDESNYVLFWENSLRKQELKHQESLQKMEKAERAKNEKLAKLASQEQEKKEQSLQKSIEKEIANQQKKEDLNKKSLEKILQAEEKASSRLQALKQKELQAKQAKDKAYSAWWESALAKKELKERTQIESISNSVRKGTESIKQDTSKLVNSFSQLKQALLAYVSIDLGRQLIKQADDFRRLEQRLTLVTRNQNEYNDSLKSVMKTSNSLGIGLKDSSAIFQRFAIELSRMGKGNKELVKFYETTLALGSVGSSSVDSMNDALIQLSQSLSGRVQADEFRSISEQAPLIAIALKEYLKVSSSELKKMFIEGRVYSDDLYKAIMEKGKLAQTIYENLPISVERSFTQLANTFSQTFAQLDKQTGISQALMIGLQGLSKLILFVANNFDTIKKVMISTAIVAGTLAIALNMSTIITAVSTALVGMNTVLRASRLAIIATQITLNPLYGALMLLATTGIVVFTNNMIDGMNKTRQAVYKQTGGMISDLDILMAKLAGVQAGLKAFGKQLFTGSVKETLKQADRNRNLKKGATVSVNAITYGENEAKKAEQAYLKKAGKNADALRMLQGVGLANTELSRMPNIGSGGSPKSAKGGQSQEAKGVDDYANALKALKDKARDAMLEVQGMDKAIQALSSGGIKAYETQLKQNDGVKKYNELMGDYLGKGKRELELIAQRIVKQEQDTEAKRKQLELSVQLAEVAKEIGIEESKSKALRDAFIAGGEKAYEIKKRELEIEQRKRDLLKGVDATEEQKKQAEEIAKREDIKKRGDELMESQVQKAKENADALRNALRSAFDNTIEHMVNGTSTFKEIMVGLLRQVAVQLIKVYALQLLTGFVGGHMTGGASAGANAGTFDKIGKAFKIDAIPKLAGRAGGGSVSAGVPYMVGEAGREMFVPRTAGNVIPTHAMPSGGSASNVTIVNNLTINTREGDDKNSIIEAGKALNALMESKVREILKTESRQGGMLHRSFA